MNRRRRILDDGAHESRMAAGNGYHRSDDGRRGLQNTEMWQAGVMGTGGMIMGGQSYMSRYWADALETVTTPAGTFANTLHVHQQRGSGYTRDVWYAPGVGMIKIDDGTARRPHWIHDSGSDGATSAAAHLRSHSRRRPACGGILMNPARVTTSRYNPRTGRYDLHLHTGRRSRLVPRRRNLMNSAGGVTATSTLDRYRGGQCVSCTYRMPAMMGNDGGVTFTFSSPNAGGALPGGRIVQIEQIAWSPPFVLMRSPRAIRNDPCIRHTSKPSPTFWPLLPEWRLCSEWCAPLLVGVSYSSSTYSASSRAHCASSSA